MVENMTHTLNGGRNLPIVANKNPVRVKDGRRQRFLGDVLPQKRNNPLTEVSSVSQFLKASGGFDRCWADYKQECRTRLDCGEDAPPVGVAKVLVPVPNLVSVGLESPAHKHRKLMIRFSISKEEVKHADEIIQ
jgi:hypothetical protein